MNSYQRLLARKAGKNAGYNPNKADGGLVGAVSGAIERVGRTFNTDNAKRIKAADAAVRPAPEAPKERASGRAAVIDDAVEKAEKGMADGGRLSAGARAALPASTFGLPGQRKYPMPDASHAANAKARATQQVARGNLSRGAEARIDAKANRILGKG